MHFGIFSYALLAALAIALLVAAVTDLRRREIDNWLNAAIAVGAPIFWFASDFNYLEMGFQVALAVIVFIVLVALFALGQMGGGDVKLLTALALWIQPLWFLRLLVVMAVAGGLLTLVQWAWHKSRKHKHAMAVPYGIAISIAGLWVLGHRYFPELHRSGLLG
ncbi:MAG: prepilin peptidase [Novosphingobium sp.]|nr:prepilin peptidase [Novosphingobium sp.]